MQIKCDHCGSVVETIEPVCSKDGDLEYTFFRCPDCKAVYPIAVTDMRLRPRPLCTKLSEKFTTHELQFELQCRIIVLQIRRR